MEDTGPYLNGVLFGLDPTLPPEEQDETWKISVKPDSSQLENLGLAGSAWTKKEQRHMAGGK